MTKTDRLAEMHRFLDERADDIRSRKVGNLRFDWANESVTFHFGESGKLTPKREERLSA
jgi:hypothetical protein